MRKGSTARFSRFPSHALSLAAALAILSIAGTASAASFTITIRNSSASPWSEGLITHSPLIALGLSPQPGSNQYFTYAFVTNVCQISDAFCGAGCDDSGNATVLARRWGLTIGTDAFVVPALAAGASTTVTFQAPATAELSYIARVTGGAIDDFVAIHTVGNQADLGAPLFSGGFPLSTIAFGLSGYDVNSMNSADGNATSCAATCPTPASGCFVTTGNGTTGATLPAQPTQPALAVGWTYNAAGFATDGLALGNVTGNNNNELVCLMEGGDYWGAAPYAGPGRSVVLSSATGVQSSAYTTAGTVDLMGFPLIENLDGGQTSEYVVNEFSSTGNVRALTGGSAAQWSNGPFGWPTFWNMGPSAGNVFGTNANEVVIADWNGNVKALSLAGAVVSTYNTFTSNGEHVYGHATLANVTGSALSEVILFGATSGKVIVLNASTAAATQLYASSGIPGGIAYGSGPAVGDIDGDGSPEIVVAAQGTGEIYAYSIAHGPGCKYKWDAGGSDYYWTSPVIGQLIAGGNKEIAVFSRDSLLSVLNTPAPPPAGTCATGTVTFQYTVGNGGSAWFTPALANLTGGAGLDVVVANYNNLEVIDVEARRLAFRHTNSTARFYPSAVISAGTAPSIFVSGWINGQVYRLDLPAGGPNAVAWPTFMGDNFRAGVR